MKSGLDRIVDALRAAGEPSRLRILSLLRHGDLSVGELVDILGQSQPGVSQHLKTLTASGLIQRLPEGSWVFYRISADPGLRALLDGIFEQLDLEAGDLARDRERLDSVREARAESADSYFKRVAESWDEIRALHYPNEAIETALLEAAGDGSYERLIDIGTGTGRILSLFSDKVQRAEGIDQSHEMLTIARANLARAGVDNASVRKGDADALPLEDEAADLVVIHQVLHYVETPERVIAEAARILRPGGRLIVVDFAPHELEFLRIDHAHRHLGLCPSALEAWTDAQGLTLVSRCEFDPPAVDSHASKDGLSVQILTSEKKTYQEEAAA